MGAGMEASWIACAHSAGDVVDGLVECGRMGRVSLGTCLACHLLNTLEGERDPDFSCTAEEEGQVRPMRPRCVSRKSVGSLRP
jgi:hypothetical protein